jgi:anti-sigma-K factor RskA
MSDTENGLDEPDPEEIDPEILSLLGELIDDDRERLRPPPSVWDAIVSTVVADRDGQPNRPLALVEDVDADALVSDISSIERQATTTIALNRPAPPVETRQGLWRQWLPVAAAIGVAIAGGLVTWAFSDQIVDPAGGEVVASVEITSDGLPVVSNGVGEARLTERDGSYQLELDVPELPAVDGFYEVWIIDTETDGMYSLGVVTGDGTFALPPNVDPAGFPVIDVSVEPVDGRPTHSGRSILRGTLDL